jgi:hypothetical protein
MFVDTARLLEAAIGIEPMNKGFADLCLTTWLRRPGKHSEGLWPEGSKARLRNEDGRMK